MNNELKPCPFCGGKAELIKGRENSDTSISYKIMCKNGFKCGCEKHFNASPYEPTYKAKLEQFILTWNTRAEPSNPPLTLDELPKMHGKPVWIIDNEDDKYWCVVAYDGGLYSRYGFIIKLEEIPSKIKAVYAHEIKENDND